MAHAANLFRQVQQFCPRHVFNGIAGQHFDGSESRRLSLYDQFTLMLCAHASQATSLREAVDFFNAHYKRHYHLGVSQQVCRSTVSDANRDRTSDFFRDLFAYLNAETFRTHKSKFSCPIKIMDSTSISSQKVLAYNLKLHVIFDLPNELTISTEFTNDSVSDLTYAKSASFEPGDMVIMDRAYFDCAWWEKLNKDGVFFITRLKAGVNYFTTNSEASESANVKSVSNIVFTGESSSQYSGNLRVITVHDERRNEDFNIVTNNHELPAEAIAELYKKRWRIEFFFKWIKQHLKIKTLFSKNENGIKIQIWTALIYYLLLWLFRESQVGKFIGGSFLRLARMIKVHMFTPNMALNRTKPPPIYIAQSDQSLLFLHPTGQ